MDRGGGGRVGGTSLRTCKFFRKPINFTAVPIRTLFDKVTQLIRVHLLQIETMEGMVASLELRMWLP